MGFRVLWVKLKKDYSKHLDISEISKSANEFYNILSGIDRLRGSSKITQLFKAETAVNNARRLVKNICSPQENKHIGSEGEKENYKQMNDNLGRVDKSTKEVKNKAMSALEMNSEYSMKVGSTVVKIEDYKRLLEEQLTNLAYYPLKNALIKYEACSHKFYCNDEEVEKDKKLLTYLIYVELLHSSESIGAETGQEKRSQLNKGTIITK